MDFKTSKLLFNITRYVGLVLILIAALAKVLLPLIVGAVVLFGVARTWHKTPDLSH